MMIIYNLLFVILMNIKRINEVENIFCRCVSVFIKFYKIIDILYVCFYWLKVLFR